MGVVEVASEWMLTRQPGSDCFSPFRRFRGNQSSFPMGLESRELVKGRECREQGQWNSQGGEEGLRIGRKKWAGQVVEKP